MTRRDRQHTHGRRVAVTALERFRLDPAVEFLSEIIRMTRRARHYRNVRVLHRPEIAVAGDAYMAGHAVARVYEIALFVHRGVVELQ